MRVSCPGLIVYHQREGEIEARTRATQTSPDFSDRCKFDACVYRLKFNLGRGDVTDGVCERATDAAIRMQIGCVCVQ